MSEEKKDKVKKTDFLGNLEDSPYIIELQLPGNKIEIKISLKKEEN